MEEYLKLGQIINTHGVRGEVKIFPLTDDIKRFKKLKFVFMKSGKEYKKVNIESLKYVKQFPVIKLEGVSTMNDAEKLKQQYIYINRENAVKLPKDTYFIADLIGLKVITEENEEIGIIEDVFSTGSNDVYQVKSSDGKEILLPAIKDVIKSVDIEQGFVKITLLEGLI